MPSRFAVMLLLVFMLIVGGAVGEEQSDTGGTVACSPLGRCTRCNRQREGLRACAATGFSRPATCAIHGANEEALNELVSELLHTRSRLREKTSKDADVRSDNSAKLMQTIDVLEGCVPSLGGTEGATGVLLLEFVCITLLIASGSIMYVRARHLRRTESK